jgi:signal recognition particle subunit SRP19
MRKQDKIVIWPAYFDSSKTRSDGRRVPKNLAMLSPRISEIKEAVEKLGLHYEIMTDAGYPKTPWLKTGMLLVKKNRTKNQTIKKIAEQLLKIRGASAQK